ncbi:MAG TPA: response regulator transcription factor [Spirochaetia bacterium]|nr:response regulator transcription factor [Spirochaetia bacterium]
MTERKSKASILVVEDDPAILELISYNLKKEGFSVRQAAHGTQALLEIGTRPPDLVILDLMLPGTGGLDICRQLKGNDETKEIPVVIVTAKTDEADVVRGLELGADDYIPKPFSPKVLTARVKTQLRRKHSRKQMAEATAGPITAGDLYIDPRRYRVEIAGEKVDLTLTEYRILVFLAQNPGWVFSRDRIVEAVRGDAYHVTDRSVDVLVFGLRKKLKEHGDLIETVRGIGYRFRETEREGA